MNVQQIEALIDLLKHVQRRPGMFIGLVNSHHLWNYLNGMYAGFELLGYKPDLSPIQDILHQRGWQTDTAFGAYPSMQAAGLSEVEVVAEELAVHIEYWQRQLNQHRPGSTK